MVKNKQYNLDEIELNFKDEKDKKASKKLDNLKKHQVSDDDLLLENTKVSITLRIDSNVLQNIKKEAEKKGLDYQTMLNGFLRKNFFDSTHCVKWNHGENGRGSSKKS